MKVHFRRSPSRMAVGVSGIIALVMATMGAPAAHGFPINEAVADCTPGTSTSTVILNWWLDDDPLVDLSEENEIRSAVQAREAFPSYQGVVLYDAREQSSSSLLWPFEVLFVNLQGERGDANCSARRLRLDPVEIEDDGVAYYDVAAHEMGHILGGQHTDNFAPNGTSAWPIMSTCVTSNDTRAIGKDDIAAFNHDDGWTSFTGSFIAANIGFEKGDASYYYSPSATTLSTLSGGAKDGGYHGRIYRNSSGSIARVDQGVNYFEDYTSPWVDARVNYRTPVTSSGSNAVQLKLYYRSIFYNSNTGTCSNSIYPDDPSEGRIQQNPPYIQIQSKYGNASTTWKYLETNNSRLRVNAGNSTTDSFDLKARFTSHLGGSWVYLDTLATRDLTNES